MFIHPFYSSVITHTHKCQNRVFSPVIQQQPTTHKLYQKLKGQLFPLFYLVVWCWQGFALSASGLEEKDSLAEVKVGEQSEKEKGVEHLQPIGGEHAVT